MRERPYRIFYVGKISDTFDIIVPNYFANFKYVKVKAINLGLDISYEYSNNIGLFCNYHSFDAFYGTGTHYLNNPSEINEFMFNFSPLLEGMKAPYAYLPYNNLYRFYFKDLSEMQTPSEITLILELEPVNFNWFLS